MPDLKVRARWRHVKDRWSGGSVGVIPYQHDGRYVVRLHFGPFTMEVRLSDARKLADHLHDLVDDFEVRRQAEEEEQLIKEVSDE